MEIATVANGCFWCTEAVFKRLKGVDTVVSGYTGGTRDNPTYEQVSTGATGHAEAIQITFDPSIISYDLLLSVFFTTHDPTTLNRQGADVGTQYRSAIFYHSDAQKKAAEEKIKQLTKEGAYKDPIVTEIVRFTKFYTAENYHKDYYDANRSYPYCRVIIDPKVKKLLKEFSKDVKDEYQES
jgi:peptide-methionine (S)-S-oxide reductase